VIISLMLLPTEYVTGSSNAPRQRADHHAC